MEQRFLPERRIRRLTGLDSGGDLRVLNLDRETRRRSEFVTKSTARSGFAGFVRMERRDMAKLLPKGLRRPSAHPAD